MRFKEGSKKQVAEQAGVGIGRMMIRLIGIRGTANHFAGIVPMRDLRNKER